MGSEVVTKIFDPLFFPWYTPDYEGPWTDTAYADIAFSREAGVYEQLKATELQGDDHIAPRYYGAWTATLGTTDEHGHFKNNQRRVGIVLIEYIKGDTISDLCHTRANILVPKTFTEKELKHRVDPTVDDNRGLILEILFDGYSRQLFSGVEQGYLHPDNILIQPRRGAGYRVVLLHYRHSVIDPLCKEPLNLYGGDGFPNPRHPFNVIHIHDIQGLIGWAPKAWADNEAFLTDWLLGTFGPLNSDEYSTEPGWEVNEGGDEDEVVGFEGEAQAEVTLENLPIRQGAFSRHYDFSHQVSF